LIPLHQSLILTTSIRKLFLPVLIFCIYLFSYGANFPGGGFQAGVVFGTLVVVFELVFAEKDHTDHYYSLIEYQGVSILFAALYFGFFTTGYFFDGLYGLQSSSPLFSSIYLWLLNLAIFLEVSGSIILIFRNFLEWDQ